MRENMELLRWLETAVSGIRFKPDRAEVRAELLAHVEDKTLDLMRIFPNIDPDEAQERALAGMGDPEELKISLAKIHRPWLGYLWQVSRVLTVVLLVLTLILWGSRAVENWKARYADQKYNQENGYDWNYVDECYESGIDPWRADGPYPAKDDGTIRTPLASLHPESSVWTGGYRFRLERAGLFCFQDGTEDPGEWWLFCEARALGLPWEPMSVEVISRLRAVDSTGRTYASSYEVYDLMLDHEGHVMVNSGGTAGLEQSFDLDIIGITPGAEWIRLEYDYAGTRWSLTIPLEAEGGGADG